MNPNNLPFVIFDAGNGSCPCSKGGHSCSKCGPLASNMCAPGHSGGLPDAAPKTEYCPCSTKIGPIVCTAPF